MFTSFRASHLRFQLVKPKIVIVPSTTYHGLVVVQCLLNDGNGSMVLRCVYREQVFGANTESSSTFVAGTLCKTPSATRGTIRNVCSVFNDRLPVTHSYRLRS